MPSSARGAPNSSVRMNFSAEMVPGDVAVGVKKQPVIIRAMETPSGATDARLIRADGLTPLFNIEIKLNRYLLANCALTLIFSPTLANSARLTVASNGWLKSGGRHILVYGLFS